MAWRFALSLSMLALLSLISGCERAAEPEATKSLLFPTLAERQDQLESLQLRGAGNVVLVTLVKKAGLWQVAERGNWPADGGRVSHYLFVLSQTHRAEAKTANPSLYSRLGVEPITVKGATGSELKLTGRGIAGVLLIGNEHNKFDSNYVRVDGQAQAWLTDLPVTFDRNPASWLDRRLVDLPLARIAQVRVKGGSGKPFSLSHRDDRFRLDGLPSGAMGDSQQGDVLAGVLDQLQLDDIRDDDSSAVVERELQFVAVDGLKLTVQAWHVDEQVWVRLLASVDEARAAEWARLATPERPASEPVAKKVAEWNQRFQGRRFLLPAESANILMLSHDEILVGAPSL